MRHTLSSDSRGTDCGWRYLRLIAETQEDKETLEALASIIPTYDVGYGDDRHHRDYHDRTRKIFPVIKNEDSSHELRLICIPPKKPFSFEKEARRA